MREASRPRVQARSAGLGAVGTVIGAAVAVATLLFGSCAAPIRIGASADPLSILEPGALAYARLSGRAARELAPALLSPSELASMKPLLARTRIVALGLGSMPALNNAQAPVLQAALIGDYPFRTAALSFGASPGWKKEKSAYYNAAMGIRAALPGPSILLASSGAIEPLLAAAKAPGPSPIPEELSSLGSRELVVWAPEPFSGIAVLLLGEAMDVPAQGLLIAASPASGQDDSYDATIAFVMNDADSLRIYKSVLKLAWYGISRMFFEGEVDIAPAYSATGRVFFISGFTLSRESLGRVLSSLRSVQRR